jgi:hypothetical protein
MMLQPRVAARAPNKIVSDGGVAKSSPAAKARARALVARNKPIGPV